MALLSGCVMMFMFIMGYFSIYINGLINRPRNNIEEIQKFPTRNSQSGNSQSDNPNQENNKTSETDTSNFLNYI
jgi:hypothetical protein